MVKCDTTYSRCLYYASNALSRIMTKMAEEEFAATGLTPSYAFILMSVNSNPGIQPKELSQYMLLAPSTVTRLVEKLEFKGYIEREINGRITKINPTQKSQELDAKLKESWMNLYKRYSEVIGEEESKNLTSDIIGTIEKME